MFASLVATIAAFAALGGAAVPARPVSGTLVGPAVTVAEQAFPAGARFVTATVSARPAAGASGRATMLSVDLTCGAESVQATTNVLTGATLTPGRVMRDATACTVVARSAVDHPTARDGLRVTATLSATAVAAGAVGYSPGGFPTVVRAGGRQEVTPVAWTPPAGAGYVVVAAAVKVTTCTSVGGSRENGSPSMCAASRVRPAGSRLRVALVAQQRAAGGGYCRVVTLSTRTVVLTRTVHHATIAQHGTFTLSTARGCARTVRVKQYARVLSGADLVIHRRGTITSVYR